MQRVLGFWEGAPSPPSAAPSVSSSPAGTLHTFLLLRWCLWRPHLAPPQLPVSSICGWHPTSPPGAGPPSVSVFRIWGRAPPLLRSPQPRPPPRLQHVPAWDPAAASTPGSPPLCLSLPLAAPLPGICEKVRAPQPGGEDFAVWSSSFIHSFIRSFLPATSLFKHLRAPGTGPVPVTQRH